MKTTSCDGLVWRAERVQFHGEGFSDTQFFKVSLPFFLLRQISQSNQGPSATAHHSELSPNGSESVRRSQLFIE